MCLSYLAMMKGGAALAEKLLDQVPKDDRDGLFVACHQIRSQKPDRTLLEKFVQWNTENIGPHESTGELCALEQFIAKWLVIYLIQDLEAVIQIYIGRTKDN